MNSATSSRSFKISYNNETKDSGSKSKQSSEELSPVPDRAEVEEPTESIPEEMEFLVGEDTDQLSDVTDPDLFGTRSSTSKSRSNIFLTWFKHICSLMKNRTVRYLTVVNAVIQLINMAILLLVVVLLFNQLILAFRISRIVKDLPSPCIFTYGPWSSCSASCWNGSSNYPEMRRYVNKSSIVQARGGMKPDCPDDLENQVDLAPCNTFRCPTNLSQYPYTECYFKDSSKESSGGCYRIRDVPLDDRLILMDSDLTQNCSEAECEHAKTFLF